MTEPSEDERAAVIALARMARMLERALSRRTTPTISVSDYRMLSAVAAGEERASRLSRRLAVGKPAVSASVESLVRRGLLTRHGGAADQRAIDLRITADGERVHREAEEALVTLVADIAARTADPAASLAALAAFGAALEEQQTERQHREHGASAAAPSRSRA